MEHEASIVLENDDAAGWKFVKACRHRMKHTYKHNMSIIRDVEKARYGKDSFFGLVENGLFVTPKFEGDYSGQAPLSDEVGNVTDDGETSAEEENNESGTDGLESSVEMNNESDVEEAEGAGEVQNPEEDGEE